MTKNVRNDPWNQKRHGKGIHEGKLAGVGAVPGWLGVSSWDLGLGAAEHQGAASYGDSPRARARDKG